MPFSGRSSNGGNDTKAATLFLASVTVVAVRMIVPGQVEYPGNRRAACEADDETGQRQPSGRP